MHNCTRYKIQAICHTPDPMFKVLTLSYLSVHMLTLSPLHHKGMKEYEWNLPFNITLSIKIRIKKIKITGQPAYYICTTSTVCSKCSRT